MENKVIDCIEWTPTKDRCVLAVTNEEFVYLIQPALYSSLINEETK